MRTPARITAALTLIAVIATAGWGCALAASPPPNTPHPVEGLYSDCRTCHENGSQGAPVTDHLKKPDCTSCHKVVIQGGP